ncbi:serine protease [Rhodosalinus sp. K401]|uniref:S1 family peptidase n=1 Tax=Rhodosalinus sp. K401 TaxID=3239195 RepID=UPI0035234A6A
MPEAGIDEWSLKAVYYEIFCEEEQIGHGTGFFILLSRVDQSDKTAFVTCRHCFTGRDEVTGNYLTGSPWKAPTKIKVFLRKKGVFKLGLFAPLDIELYCAREPQWFEHEALDRGIDLAALFIERPEWADIYYANSSVADDTTYSTDMSLDLGMDLFVLGFPFRIDVYQLAIWKRASVASEPSVARSRAKDPFFFVDTSSRPGMSGSLVIQRAFGSYMNTTRDIVMKNEANKIIGVYCGRYVAPATPLEAPGAKDLELGRVHDFSLVLELLKSPRRAENPHCG